MEQSVIGAEHGGQQVIQDAVGGLSIDGLARDLERREVCDRQVGVADQHFLVVRHLPVPTHRVPEEPLVLAVVDAVPHAFESGFHHCQQGAVTGETVAGDEELQRFPRGLLGLEAEPAELLVIEFLQPTKHRVDGCAGTVAGWRPRSDGRAGCFVDELPAGYLFQQGGHLVRGGVGPAGQKLALRGQEGHRGIGALVVSQRDVRPLVDVHADRDEPGVGQLDHPRIRVGGLVHHVTPVAPGRAEGQQHRLVFGPGSLEGFLAPVAPGDAVAAVRLAHPLTSRSEAGVR